MSRNKADSRVDKAILIEGWGDAGTPTDLAGNLLEFACSLQPAISRLGSQEKQNTKIQDRKPRIRVISSVAVIE